MILGHFVMVNFFTPRDCGLYNYPSQSYSDDLFVGCSANDVFAFGMDGCGG
jgi:hypothetical protein